MALVTNNLKKPHILLNITFLCHKHFKLNFHLQNFYRLWTDEEDMNCRIITIGHV